MGILQAIFVNPNTKSTTTRTPVVVTSATISRGNELSNGLYFGQANISLTASSVQDIVNYLTFLTTNSPYAFVLSDITLPLDTNPVAEAQTENITVPVTLGMYYYPDKK